MSANTSSHFSHSCSHCGSEYSHRTRRNWVERYVLCRQAMYRCDRCQRRFAARYRRTWAARVPAVELRSFAREMMAVGLAALLVCLPLWGMGVAGKAARAKTAGPVAALAGGALMHTMAGVVAIDGAAVKGDRAVSVGQTIMTGGEGSARVAVAGDTRATLIAASKTRFRVLNANQGVELSYGMLEVTGRERVLTGRGEVEGASDGSRYAVLSLRNAVYVEDRAGDLVVRGDAGMQTLHAGDAVELNAAPAAPAAMDQSQAGQTQSGQTTPAVPATASEGGISTPVLVGIIAAGAVVAGVVIYEATKSNNTASPSQ